MKPLWAGRLEAGLSPLLEAYNASILVDRRLYAEDIEGSIAHAHMLGRQGIIPKEEAQALVQALEQIRQDIEAGTLVPAPPAEDIHSFIEQVLTERLGATGKRLHTGRSRNDQVALDLRLYTRKAITPLMQDLLALIADLAVRAQDELHTLMPGYTHSQRAQPITLAHHLMAYAQMFQRDYGRLEDAEARLNFCPLGSGALAGTTYPIDRTFTSQWLGFQAPCLNSLDGVSDRDYCLEITGALALLMMHLSRFCEEIIAWCSWEYRFAELGDHCATGSSIMPQKKNPDFCELIRGKTARVYGRQQQLLSLLKALPLAYNKDLQEDKEAFFDVLDTTAQSLAVFRQMFAGLRFKPERMRQAVAEGFLNATDCADYLVKKGLPFRDAYHLVGRLVQDCLAQSLTLEQLPLAHYQAQCPLFEADVYEALDLDRCVAERKSLGGPAPEAVRPQIEQALGFVAQHQAAPPLA